MNREAILATLPPSPVRLDGFKICKVRPCRREETGDGRCAADGGQQASLEVLRRHLNRVARGEMIHIIECGECESLPLDGLRCVACAFSRGVVMAFGEVAEVMGWQADTDPLLALISVPR